MPLRETAPTGAPCWVDLFTTDPDGARSFYSALFGWTALEPNPDFGGYFNFQRDGVMVAGGMGHDGSEGPSRWSVYLATDDIAAVAAAVTANGGQMMFEPMPVADLGSMAVAVDAGGAAIGMWQPGLHKGFGVLAEPGAPAWFELHTRDYDASVAFYRTVFGWATETMSDTPEFHYTTLGSGEDALAGIMDSKAMLPEGVPPHWLVYFAVADADASAAKVTEMGGTVLMGPHDTPYGRLVMCTDPVGATFALMGPTSDATAS